MTVGDNFMYRLNNVCLECWFSSGRVLQKKVEYLFTEHTYIDHCTYLGFGLLEAPCKHVLHGPLLGIYWLRLRPHFRAPTLEATLLWRRLFIVSMTAAHISPTSFPSNCTLLVYWTSYFNTKWCTHTYYTLHSHPHILHYVTLYYTVSSHYLASSFLPHYVTGWLLSIHCVRYNNFHTHDHVHYHVCVHVRVHVDGYACIVCLCPLLYVSVSMRSCLHSCFCVSFAMFFLTDYYTVHIFNR